MAKSVGGGRRGRSAASSVVNDLDVFINCPFDAEYKPIFNATVFTVVRSGYRARCALETDDSAENRLGKIIRIIEECRFGVHDISRTETGGDPPLPRFNMPLELGLWLGAKNFGKKGQENKSCIVFDRDKYRYQKFISDINGQDIHAHSGSIELLIAELSTWLRNLPGGVHAGGGKAIMAEYRGFEEFLPDLCQSKKMTVDELSFSDFNLFVTEYVASLTSAPDAAQGVNPGSVAHLNSDVAVPDAVKEGMDAHE